MNRPRPSALARTRLQLVLTILLVSVAGAGAYFALGRRPAAAPLRIPAPREPRAAYQDMAVACLTMGTLSPPLAEIEPARFDSMVRALAWVLESYHGADFEAFLLLHRADLEHADRERRADVGPLAAIMQRDLGVSVADVPAGWVDALELFWHRLYPAPVLRELAPETSAIELSELAFDPADPAPDLSAFWAPFEERRESHRRRINHEIALPHRRAPEAIAAEEHELAWFDFQVDVVLGAAEQLPGSILLRFVWDGLDGNWFLARAVTIYPDQLDPGSTRSLLLF